MSEKSNDIHNLDSKARILAALSGRGYPNALQRTVRVPAPAFESSAPGFPLTPPEQSAAPAPEQTAFTLALPDAPVLTAGSESVGRDVLARFLASRVSPQTRRAYFYALARVARILGAVGPEAVPWHELRFDDTDLVRSSLLAGAFARSTVCLTLDALSGVLRQAKRMGLMSADDYDRATDWTRPSNEALPAGRELSQEELEKIQAFISRVGGSYGLFLEALFALILGTGLRAIEVCRATVEAYDPAGFIRVVRKGGREDELPLGTPEVKALEAWLAERPRFARWVESPALLLRVQSNDWVRATHPHCSEKHLWRVCQTVAAGAGTQPFTPHDCRRTFCTRALRQGDVLMVQTLMGHAKLETTKRYDRRPLEERARARRSWNIWRPPPTPANDGHDSA